MHFSALAVLEDSLLLTGNNREYVLRPFNIAVPGEELLLKGCLCTPAKRSGYYYGVAYPKKRIVLHYTAGQIRSDLSTLTRNDYHVSVPFVIGRNGTIYQLFSSRYWSGHLGKGIGNTQNGNAEDKVTIGIELSNYGYLVKQDDNFETVYSRQRLSNGKSGPADIYCSEEEQTAYHELPVAFRGQRYFASYTPGQYQSLIVLLRYLTAQYGIERNFLPEPQRYNSTAEVLNFSGIVSHINYRPDGKWDIGPAFDWQQVIEGVQAERYPQPAAARMAVSRNRREKILTSEEAMESFLPAPANPLTEDEEYE